MNQPLARPARRSNRLPLLGLAALFVAPLAVAFWLYYGTGWRPSGTTNHGRLITPVRGLPTLAYPQAASATAVDSIFHGKWSLVVIAAGECNADCQSSLVYARQTWLSLGRLGTRVQRVLLAPAGCCDRTYLDREHSGLQIVDLAGNDSALTAASGTLLSAFAITDQSQQIFVVDPLGNLMMSYDTRQNPKGLREDLKKLLDLSHIG